MFTTENAENRLVNVMIVKNIFHLLFFFCFIYFNICHTCSEFRVPSVPAGGRAPEAAPITQPPPSFTVGLMLFL